jgi:hypothetical protein
MTELHPGNVTRRAIVVVERLFGAGDMARCVAKRRTATSQNTNANQSIDLPAKGVSLAGARDDHDVQSNVEAEMAQTGLVATRNPIQGVDPPSRKHK